MTAVINEIVGGTQHFVIGFETSTSPMMLTWTIACPSAIAGMSSHYGYSVAGTTFSVFDYGNNIESDFALH